MIKNYYSLMFVVSKKFDGQVMFVGNLFYKYNLGVLTKQLKLPLSFPPVEKKFISYTICLFNHYSIDQYIYKPTFMNINGFIINWMLHKIFIFSNKVKIAAG